MIGAVALDPVSRGSTPDARLTRDRSSILSNGSGAVTDESRVDLRAPTRAYGGVRVRGSGPFVAGRWPAVKSAVGSQDAEHPSGVMGCPGPGFVAGGKMRSAPRCSPGPSHV